MEDNMVSFLRTTSTWPRHQITGKLARRRRTTMVFAQMLLTLPPLPPLQISTHITVRHPLKTGTRRLKIYLANDLRFSVSTDA